MNSSRKVNVSKDKKRKPGCPIPLPSGLPLPASFEQSIIMMCSNECCPYPKQLMHVDCFQALENNLLKTLNHNLRSTGEGSDDQRQINLWDSKRFPFIQHKCRCRCGLGALRPDQTDLCSAGQNYKKLIVTDQKNSPTKPIVFTSRKVSSQISYAEATVVKRNDSDSMSNKNYTTFSNVNLCSLDSMSSFPMFESVELSRNPSNVSCSYKELQNSVSTSQYHSPSYDDISRWSHDSYYHIDANGFFISPVDLSATPSDITSSFYYDKDEKIAWHQKSLMPQDDEESTSYYDLFNGCSFNLGEILISETREQRGWKKNWEKTPQRMNT
ncbi:unnamed protein product [Thelazia callipaeda]|uniref:Expressed conserved protein n=1 Tax=Thelazia callipaeda TaxID=103827 RepID=A0A0N5D3S8_THECL|nr:unnamed protein product [Thelazia callipaeda]